MVALLALKDVHVRVEGKEVVKGVSLSLERGKVHVLMGPNGSGKSSLAYALMGHPRYEITKGDVLFEGTSLLGLSVHERSRKGIFLSFQHPVAVEGVSVTNMLRAALQARGGGRVPFIRFRKQLVAAASALGIPESFLDRNLNEGFSGGEKKKFELLQLLVLDPKLAILDEIDSGLDIDALKVVAKGVNTFLSSDKAVLIITHYKRLLDHCRPDRIFILKDGKVVQEGDGSLADHLEEKGYAWLEEGRGGS
ncbi:Fe-S cluster assembly ATPase SufC [Candidatus Woesearchaeota archaeon]|nr:MAG: Fe-S cluster assembly ATPase SufC [Candidatus Woesearchaeota archaeon]